MKTNPWLGLSSYDEEKIGAGYKFCGRSLATNELFSLVDNNILVTMYGKSGIGKSSLLQAGLFPKLRDNDYFPVYIRLGNDDTSGLTYAKMIVDTINAELCKAGFTAVVPDNAVAGEEPESSADDFLWHYFVTREFRGERGRVVFPVIVIDQFEELFFLDKQRLVTLLRQVYMLMDDSSLSSSSLTESYVTNFRFLFSIREDDFFRLEDVIERQRLVEMKYNRYRLVELNDNDAADVIMQPAGNILKRDEEQLIVQRIIKEAKGDTGEINSAILSLLCSRLYDATIAKGESEITLHSLSLFLQSSGGNFFASFFDDVMKQLNDREKWEYIEDALVTDDGRRNSVLESQFNKAVPNCDFLFNGKMAMLRYVTYSAGTGRHVEMIHDLLANHLKTSRNERRQKAELQKMRRRQRRNAAVIAVALLLIAFFAYQFVSISRKNNEITKKNEEITKGRENLLITQSRYLMSEAQKEYDKGNITKALRMALYALPKDLENPERPYVVEAERMLRNSLMPIAEHVVLRTIMQPEGSVYKPVFSPDGKNILTVTDDNSVCVWDALTGTSVIEPLRHNAYVYSAVYSPDGRYILTASSDSTAVVWDAETGKPLLPPLIHDAGVQSAAFSPDGKRVLTNVYGRTYIWDAFTGELLIDPLSPKFIITSSAFVLEGEEIVAESSVETFRIWDMQSGKFVTDEPLWQLHCLVFSPDGKYAVTASLDSTVCVWNVEKGDLVAEPLKHDEEVYFAEFSSDGKYVATVAFDKTVRIWDVETGKPMTGPLRHDDEVDFVKFSPDGRYIATASYDNTARVWNVGNGSLVTEMLHDGYVVSVIFTSEGKSVITESEENDKYVVRVWDLETGRLETEPLDCGYTLNRDFAFSPDRKYVVKANKNDETACVWNVRTGEPVTAPLPHGGYVSTIAFSSDGKSVLTASDDSTVVVWNVMTGEQIGKPLQHNDWVYSAALSPDGRYVFTEARGMHVWDAVTGNQVVGPLQDDQSHTSAAFSPDGRYIAIASDTTVRICDTVNGNMVTEAFSYDENVFSMDFSPDGRFLITKSYEDCVLFADSETGGLVTEPYLQADFVAYSSDGKCAALVYGTVAYIGTEKKSYAISSETDVYSVVFSPCGKYFAILSHDNTVSVWETATAKSLIEPFMHDKMCGSPVFSPDGNYIITCFDSTVSIREIKTAKLLTPTLGHNAYVKSAVFSPDGKSIATVSNNNMVCIWDFKIDESLRHKDIVSYAVYSPDGKYFLTASWDSTVVVWDAQTAQPLTKPFRHDNRVNFADFSPNGKYVIAKTSKRYYYVWDISTGELVIEPWQTDYRVSFANFSTDCERFVSASSGNASVWNLETGKLVIEELKHNRNICSAVFSPDGNYIVTASDDATACVWDAQNGKLIAGPLRHKDYVATAVFSPDGKYVATASGDGTAHVWDALTGNPVTEPLQHGKDVGTILFSPDGRYILTVTLQGDVARVWECEKWKLIAEVLSEVDFSSVLFSPDGRHILAISYDGRGVYVWDALTGKPVAEPMRHDGDVSSALFSHDGKYILTCSFEDGTVCVWDAQTGVLLTEILRCDYHVRSAVFSPDDRSVLTASDDGIVRVLPFSPLQELLDKYNKDPEHDWSLSEEEKEEYSLE